MRHRHWLPWRWEPWIFPHDLMRRLTEDGFEVTTSRKCSRCPDHVQFRMIKRP